MIRKMPTEPEYVLLSDLLGAEIASARIEAALDADRTLAVLWRSEAAIVEAAASIGLEDVRISERDLLLRVASNGASGVEARAVEDALDVLRFLRAPGNALEDPLELCARVWRLSRRGDQGAVDAGEAMQLSENEAVEIFAQCRGRAPVLEAILAARRYALLTERASPVGERMIFSAAEQASRARGGGMPRAGADEDILRGLGGRISARWVALPATAMSSGRFHIWSPSGAQGVRNILSALAGHQHRELGRLIPARAWIEKMRGVGQGRHGRSRLADAAGSFGLEPLQTSGRLADLLGITQRGAINLLEALMAEGLVCELTHRRAARIWATPMLAARLGAMPVRRTHPAGRPGSPGPGKGRGPDEADAAAAMEDFDKIMGEADALLARFASRSSGF